MSNVVIYKIVVRVPCREASFDCDVFYGQEWVFLKMSKEHFDALFRCLNSDAPWDLSQADCERMNKEDPLWQTDKFCEKLLQKFMHYWLMGQCADLSALVSALVVFEARIVVAASIPPSLTRIILKCSAGTA
jgi:hypothetical protein